MANPVSCTEPATSGYSIVDSATQAAYEKTRDKVHAEAVSHIVFVNANTQLMHVYDQKTWVRYSISTSEKGLGQEENTGKTPLGLHRVEVKIGDGAKPLEIFESRINTKKLAEKNTLPSKIVGRILRLKGLEEGHNLGKNEKGVCVDTFDRYIYIHGTNMINELGLAKSAGCIRMHPNDAIDLYAKLPIGSHVYIYG